MSEKEYLILLDVDVRKRHFHRTAGGMITDFVVQLEVMFEGKWRPAIRYDCAHDFAHKDRYNSNGDSRKIRIYMEYNEALTFADDDLDENWQLYKVRFLRGEFA